MNNQQVSVRAISTLLLDIIVLDIQSKRSDDNSADIMKCLMQHLLKKLHEKQTHTLRTGTPSVIMLRVMVLILTLVT